MSTLIRPPDSAFPLNVGAVDIPYRELWRRAHFLGVSQARSVPNLVAGGNNPLTVVGAPTYEAGYAVTSSLNGYAAPNATPEYNRTSILIASQVWTPNTPEFQAGLWKPAEGRGTVEQGYNNPAGDGSFWGSLWFGSRYQGVYDYTASVPGAGGTISFPEPQYLYQPPPPQPQRPDMSITPPRQFAATVLTTNIATGKVVLHLSLGYSLYRTETTLSGAEPPPQQLHVSGHSPGSTGVSKRAVAFIGELPARSDAEIATILDWLWAELASRGVSR